MPPNLVVIMADQLRSDALGEHTPHLNALTAEGTRFDRCYCASPLCVPARGSFFTGMYPNETGSVINPWVDLDYQHGLVRKGTANLYGLLEGTYDSRHIGKQHLFTEEYGNGPPSSQTQCTTLGDYSAHCQRAGVPTPGGPAYRRAMAEPVQNRFTRRTNYSIPTTGCYEQGFDYFFDGFIANNCVDAIRNRDKEKPLLLNAMFLAPHPPLQIPEPWFSMIKDVNLPENVGAWGQDQSPLQLYNLTGQLGQMYSREDWERIWPVYLGLVALLDHAVGMILETLKTEGLYDDSIILFTADHGEQLGSHGLWQKMCNYEESARVPCILRTPTATQARLPQTFSEPVSHIDMLPTLLDLIGQPTPATATGTSLLPMLHGEAPARDRIYIQFDGNGARGNFSRAVIAGDLKLNVDLFKDERFFELYDLGSDPQEMTNLAFEKPEEVEGLLADLIAHMERTGDLLTLTPEDYQTFREGYAPLRALS